MWTCSASPAESTEGKAANAKVQQLTQTKATDISTKTKQLDAANQKMQQGGAVLNDAARALQKEVDRLTVEIDRLQQDAQAEVQEFQQAQLADFQDKLKPVVEGLVKELGVGLLFSMGDAGAIFMDPSLDITLEVIKRFDAASAAKPGAPAAGAPAARAPDATGGRRAKARGPRDARADRTRCGACARAWSATRSGQALRGRGQGQGAKGKSTRDARGICLSPLTPRPFQVIYLHRVHHVHHRHPRTPRPPLLPPSVAAGRRHRRARAGEAAGGPQERHGQRRFFQGHFPGAPLMPGVLMLETLTQVAALLLLEREGPMPMSRIFLHGVNAAKFRRQVVPGDRLRLEVTLGRTRTSMAKAHGVAYVGDQIVAEADLLLALRPMASGFIPPRSS